ncbi:MAG: adenosine deaminase [Spirochaetes bacterium]|nr:adenosine deaminase [Spirochaetota bacterium]
MLEKEEFLKKLKKIPKIEIHLHSEGIISKATATKILNRSRSTAEEINVDEVFNYESLEAFIKVFLDIQKAFQQLSDFTDLFNDIKQYFKDNGIIYGELFFSPSFFIKQGWDFDQLINILIKKIRSLRFFHRINIKLIIDISRTFGVKNAENNLNRVIRYITNNPTPEIIGIGLGGDEAKGPAKDFTDIFKKAKEYGLHRVAHAGEDVGPESVWDAVNLLKAERIGHGISSISDKELMTHLVKNKIPLEICPTSNIFTKKYVKNMKDHPVKPFFKENIMVTLNTDDPTFFHTNLLTEYWNLYSQLDFSLDDLKNVLMNGVKASFMTPTQKERFLAKIEQRWSQVF